MSVTTVAHYSAAHTSCSRMHRLLATSRYATVRKPSILLNDHNKKDITRMCFTVSIRNSSKRKCTRSLRRPALHITNNGSQEDSDENLLKNEGNVIGTFTRGKYRDSPGSEESVQHFNFNPEEPANQLHQLASMSIIVADTGDFEQMKEYRPQDATTNPSLVYQACELPQYAYLIEEAVAHGKKKGSNKDEQLGHAMDMLACLFGREISHIIPGNISTEVDARLSFDTHASIDKARELIGIYESLGVDKSRILIKLASTWEMMKAIEELQKDGIRCNMTLMFSLSQAVAAAQRGAFLVSPFVGRILDWYKKTNAVDSYPAADDPGVRSVQDIYNYYRCHGHKTIVMGASFRNKDEILQLAGCDRLTISPKFLKELEASTEPVPVMLSEDFARECDIPLQTMDEKTFRWMLNNDAMATEKLADGIRGFTRDLVKLEDKLRPMF